MNSLWAAMWPNVFAPSFWTLAGILASHLSLRRLHNRRFDELKTHLKPGPDIIHLPPRLTEAEYVRLREEWIAKYAPKDSA